MRHASGVLLVVALCAGCELQEVTIAEPADVLVVELILRVGSAEQTALVHRSAGAGIPPELDIVVSPETGLSHRFQEVAAQNCLAGEDPPADVVRCYSARPFFVEPRRRYTLEGVTPDGRVFTGTTRAPGTFSVRTPAEPLCVLPVGTNIELAWTAARDAWVYIVETNIAGLAPAFGEAGITLPDDPLRLVGLSISREDTTITFPSEFGLFDRFDDDVADALVALQEGLPAGASAFIVVGAADRNYVNWVRGGNFNPSGTVRVPSLFGEGVTGVFGSVTEQRRRISTEPAPGPACLS